LTGLTDTVTDFSWEPKGERFAIVASSDPNLGNSGAGVTIKTDVNFYQLDRSKNDFKILRVYFKDDCGRDLNINLPVSLQARWRAARQTRSDGRRGTPRRARDGRLDIEIGAGVLGSGFQFG
jgi:hypothetical protein